MTSARLPSNRFFVRATVTAMLALTARAVTPWKAVAIWLILMALLAGAEEWSRRYSSPGHRSWLRLIAPLTRVLISVLYAAAAWQLIAHGGPGSRLVAFSAMASSTVYVLMAHYRSLPVVLASVAPYFAVIGVVSVNMARSMWGSGQPLVVVSAAFPASIFALLLWSARDQLTESWNELTRAREAAEERELAAASANRAKSQFLTTMSHEFRTPLNGVLGMAQAMTKERLSPQQREQLKVIRRSGENLLSILNDLLDLSKIEANTLELEIAEFDVEHLVRGVAAAFSPIADQKGVTFELVIENGVGGRYLGDARLIRRALYCLTDNAVKFTHKGCVTLRVERDCANLVFHVIDTGIGVSSEGQARLFENFYQVDHEPTRRFGGAGIGLPLSLQITRRMGGTLTVSSEPAEGSRFTLSLPLPSVAMSAADHSDGAACHVTQLRVLAAEDNPTNQFVLKTLLMQVGITPEFVADGSAAVKAWQAKAWDLVLMDIQMPQMDGETAVRLIREQELREGRTRTPIVAVTANVMTDQVARYRSVGFDEIVPKPIELRRLVSAIDGALNQAELGEPSTPSLSTSFP